MPPRAGKSSAEKAAEEEVELRPFMAAAVAAYAGVWKDVLAAVDEKTELLFVAPGRRAGNESKSTVHSPLQ